MNAKTIAAAAAGLCLMWGTAQAEDEAAQQRSPASPIEAQDAVGSTNGGAVVREVGPTQRGASAEDMTAMQMLLLQFLLNRPDSAANPDAFEVPRAPTMIGI